MELAELIFLIAQASITISWNCQQWVIGTVFPLTSASIPDLIVQPLTNKQVAMEFPVDTIIVHITNETSPLVRSCRPILRIRHFVDIRRDSERSVVDFAAYVYLCTIVSHRELALRAYAA
uniref:Uncharacterized protein n=1 Tax=Romanomermis culicivorax TaxID=13658 RepID=A0A915I2Q6_ROMCU